MTKPQETISLVDDQGQEHEFRIVDVIEVAQQRYAILQPTEGDEEAVVFRVEDDETLTTVEDDEEFERVAAALEDLKEYDEVELSDEEGEEADAAEDEDDDREDDADAEE